MRQRHSLLTILCLLVFTSSTLRGEDAQPEQQAAPNHRIIVFYLHTTFRCYSCVLVEQLTKVALYGGVVDESLAIEMAPIVSPFAEEVKKGALEFVSLNVELEENKPLAEALGSVMITPIVAEVRDGMVISYAPLTQAGRLVQNLEAFKTYVYGAIRHVAKEKKVFPVPEEGAQ